MGAITYLLATDARHMNGDVIHSRDTALKIRVFCLDKESFDPNPEEIQLYGFAGKELYAFETIGLRAEDALDVVNAIKWYARYRKYPEMEILPEDPRAGETIAV